MKYFIWPLLLVLFSFGALLVNRHVGEFEIIYNQAGYVSIVTKAPVVKIALMGDIMFSRKIGSIITEYNDFNFPFRLVKDLLGEFDLRLANLENPVSTVGKNQGSIYSFRANPKTVEGLKYAGIDVVSLANNHIWDYGAEAFNETMNILDSAGIAYVGGGRDYTQARTPVIKTIKGVRVAFLGYTNLVSKIYSTENSKPTTAFIDTDKIIADIDSVQELADLVIVSFHWGDEYKTKHNKTQEKLAKAAIDAGADIIAGHHPHVVQEVERYKDGYIFYSLGNFVFDQNFSKDTEVGLIGEVVIENRKIAEVKSHKVNFNKLYQPFLVSESSE